jgi:hypothetical protein
MDYRIFNLLKRWNYIVKAPSPFATRERFAEVAKQLWLIVKTPSMSEVWRKDQGFYRKTIEAARYCEDRANR